jgi:hypothetical protein
MGCFSPASFLGNIGAKIKVWPTTVDNASRSSSLKESPHCVMGENKAGSERPGRRGIAEKEVYHESVPKHLTHSDGCLSQADSKESER